MCAGKKITRLLRMQTKTCNKLKSSGWKLHCLQNHHQHTRFLFLHVYVLLSCSLPPRLITHYSSLLYILFAAVTRRRTVQYLLLGCLIFGDCWVGGSHSACRGESSSKSPRYQTTSLWSLHTDRRATGVTRWQIRGWQKTWCAYFWTQTSRDWGVGDR